MKPNEGDIEKIIDALINYRTIKECPKCRGNGRKKNDNFEGYIVNGKFAQHTCIFCCGEGTVKAKLNVDWVYLQTPQKR